MERGTTTIEFPLPTRDNEEELIIRHISGAERAQAICATMPLKPGDLQYMLKYADNLYTKRMFDPVKIRAMKCMSFQVFPELLEWCDRPEDERRKWHILSRYLDCEE